MSFINMIKKILQLILTILISGFAGCLLLGIAFLLPTDRIYSHVMESVPMLVQETNTFSLTPADDGAYVDNWTDSIYLNEAMIGPGDDSLLKNIVSGYTYNVENGTLEPVENLYMVMTYPEEADFWGTHYRFFNGYEIFIKPLLIFTTFGGIRELNLYICLFLTLLLMVLMFRRGFQSYIPAVIAALLFIRPLTVAMCMAFAGFYYCMVIPCIFMFLIRKETLQKRAWLIFAVTGACTFYFNMNYFQLLCFAMPLVFYFLITGFPDRPAKLIKTAADCFAAWFICYTGMMFFKWTVYAIVKNASIFQTVLDSFLYRMGTDSGSRIEGIVKNVAAGTDNIWWIIVELVFIVYSIIQLIRIRKQSHRITLTSAQIILFAIMTVSPFVRCFILSNHVNVHYFITYRIFMMPVLAFNIILTNMRCTDDNGLVRG